MSNVEVSIQATIKPTEVNVVTDNVARQMEDGHVRLVLPKGAVFNIDRLEQGVLQTAYPAMGDALACALAKAPHDKAVAGWDQEGGLVGG